MFLKIGKHVVEMVNWLQVFIKIVFHHYLKAHYVGLLIKMGKILKQDLKKTGIYPINRNKVLNILAPEVLC